MPQTNPTRSHGHTRRGKSGARAADKRAVFMAPEAQGHKQESKLGGHNFVANFVMIAAYVIVVALVVWAPWHRL